MTLLDLRDCSKSSLIGLVFKGLRAWSHWENEGWTNGL